MNGNQQRKKRKHNAREKSGNLPNSVPSGTPARVTRSPPKPPARPSGKRRVSYFPPRLVRFAFSLFPCGPGDSGGPTTLVVLSLSSGTRSGEVNIERGPGRTPSPPSPPSLPGAEAQHGRGILRARSRQKTPCPCPPPAGRVSHSARHRRPTRPS